MLRDMSGCATHHRHMCSQKINMPKKHYFSWNVLGFEDGVTFKLDVVCIKVTYCFGPSAARLGVY